MALTEVSVKNTNMLMTRSIRNNWRPIFSLLDFGILSHSVINVYYCIIRFFKMNKNNPHENQRLAFVKAVF